MRRMLRLALFCLLPMPVWAQPLALSLDAALHRALGRPEVMRQVEAARAEGAGLEQLAARWPNPEFSVDQEQVSGGGSETTERIYALSQTFDVSGERPLRRQAAAAAARVRQAQVSELTHGIREQVRTRYFEALYAQHQTRTLDGWLARLAQLTDDLLAQVERGEASRYDYQRLAQTRLAFSARQMRAEAGSKRQLARLRVLVGLPKGTELRLTDELVPPAPPTLAALRDAADRHPELTRLAALRDQTRLDARTERRAVVPDPRFTLGRKTVRGSGLDEDGYVLGLSLPLPVFDRHSGQVAIASARAADRDAEYLLTRATHIYGMEADWMAYVQLRERLVTQIAAAEASAEALVSAAEAGYAGAEQGVLELADAYEVALSTLLDSLALAHEARVAHSELVAHLHGDHPHD